MRFFMVSMVAAASALIIPASALAKPPGSCAVNDRGGSATVTRWLPNEGRVRNRLAFGTEVEIVTVAVDGEGCPWALVRQPGELDWNYGWADRQHLTCR